MQQAHVHLARFLDSTTFRSTLGPTPLLQPSSLLYFFYFNLIIIHTTVLEVNKEFGISQMQLKLLSIKVRIL